MKRTGLASLIGVKLKYFVFLIDFLSINSLINQQPSSFASFKPGLKDGAHHYIKGQASHGLQKPRVHQVVRWQNGSWLACGIKVSGSFPSIYTEILHLQFSSSPKVFAQFSLPAEVSSILNVQFSDVKNSGCACGFSVTILMCNYPNVHIAEWAKFRVLLSGVQVPDVFFS